MNEDGNDLAERAFLRRKREDAAFAVPMLGVILLASPLLNVVSGGTRLWGIPLAYVYIFASWAGLILLTRYLIRGLTRAPEGEDDA